MLYDRKALSRDERKILQVEQLFKKMEAEEKFKSNIKVKSRIVKQDDNIDFRARA